MDAQQAAEMFLRTLAGPHDVRDVHRLTLLLNEFAMCGHELALDKAQSIYRTLHHDHCRPMADPNDCECFVCQAERAKLRGPSSSTPPEPKTRF